MSTLRTIARIREVQGIRVKGYVVHFDSRSVTSPASRHKIIHMLAWSCFCDSGARRRSRAYKVRLANEGHAVSGTGCRRWIKRADPGNVFICTASLCPIQKSHSSISYHFSLIITVLQKKSANRTRCECRPVGNKKKAPFILREHPPPFSDDDPFNFA